MRRSSPSPYRLGTLARWLGQASLIFFWPATLFCGSAVREFSPITYLTLGNDPLKEMEVCWITALTGEASYLQFRKGDEEGWSHRLATSTAAPKGYPATVHKVLLENLSSDTLYFFQTGDEARVHSFKTLADPEKKSLSFVVGGDCYHDALSDLTAIQKYAAAKSPSFALLGGDLAYSGSRFSFFQEDAERWLQFLSCWQQSMVTPEGCLVPLLCTVGNHDVCGRYGQTVEQAAWFHTLFGEPERTVDFGKVLSIFLLDSGHTRAIGGEQRQRLSESLAERRSQRWKVACYHVPAYPCVRRMDSGQSPLIRKEWVPLFEKEGLDIAFENHDHAYKRTARLLGGQPSSSGVVYMGDGAWGIHSPRTPRSLRGRPFIAASYPQQHFLFVDISSKEFSVTAYNRSGSSFDHLHLTK